MLREYSSNDIVWNGPNIPCINLCKGDTVSDVIFKIATEVCSIVDNLDITTLSYECIVDKAKTYGKIDLFLLFSILLKNDCDIYDLVQKKYDELDNTELLVENLDIKCFLQDYLDKVCTIIRFYNQPGSEINPNNEDTVFQNSIVEAQESVFTTYYVSDVDQSVWIWNKHASQFIKDYTDLNTNCVCELDQLDLDVPKVLQVIIDNICQTKSSGIIDSNNHDAQYKTVIFNTIDPNHISTVFIGDIENVNNYYISSQTHLIWRWSLDDNKYVPSLLSSSNISISGFDSYLDYLELQYQNWVSLYQVYQEPFINSCLSDDNLLLNDHISIVSDANICNYQTLIGSPKDVWFASLSKCDNIVYFTGIANDTSMNIDGIANDVDVIYVNILDDHPWVWNGLQYVPYLVNLAFAENHQWAKVCDILNRLKTLETTCCTPTCDNTTIGFTSVYNDDSQSFSLLFNKASGTNIPDGFTDCGSVLTAIDHKGVKIELNIELVQDLIIDLDVSLLDTSEHVNVNIKSCLSDGTLTCSNCNSFILPIIQTCGFCKICAYDEEEGGEMEVVYSLASNPSFIIKDRIVAGQCITFKMPDDLPTIYSVSSNNKTMTLLQDPETSCSNVDIPGIAVKSCWFFPIPARDVSVTLDVDGIVIGKRYDQDYQTQSTDHLGQTTVFNNIQYVSLLNDGVNIPLSGDTTSFTPIMGGSKEGSSKELSYDRLNTYPIIPTGFSGSSCGTIEYSYFAGLAQGKQDVSNTADPDLGWTRVNTGQHGVVLEINTLSVPEITLIDTISGNHLYTKGILVTDDCNCPS